jgi:hypothetical protein
MEPAATDSFEQKCAQADAATLVATPEKEVHASADPLCEGATLQHVLDYVGPGRQLFIALVSRAWAHRYSQVPARLMAG